MTHISLCMTSESLHWPIKSQLSGNSEGVHFVVTTEPTTATVLVTGSLPGESFQKFITLRYSTSEYSEYILDFCSCSSKHATVEMYVLK
jgi:hypothetical protein